MRKQISLPSYSIRCTNSPWRIGLKLLFKIRYISGIFPIFRSCISKINNTLDNAEDLDIVLPMYNRLYYSDDYSLTSGSFWNYYRDEVNYSVIEVVVNYRINRNETAASRFLSIRQK